MMQRLALTIAILFFLVNCALFDSWLPSAPSEPTPVPLAQPAIPRYKLIIPTEGMYRVTASALRAAGADPNQIDAPTLQLFRGDHEIAIRMLGAPENFALEFFAPAPDSTFSNFDVYWFRWGAQPGKRMREVPAAPTGAPKDSVTSVARASKPSLYIVEAGIAGEHWFWQSLSAPTTTTITLTLPSAISANAQLRTYLWSRTQDAANNPDHHLTVQFNTTRVADEKWDGQGARTITATIPANLVKPGENSIRLIAPGDTPAAADIVLLRALEMTYTRRLIAQDDALIFQTDAGAYRVDGFAGDAIDLFDITDPAEPQRATGATITNRALTFGSSATRRWLALGANARRMPTKIALMTGAELRASRPADYIIITHANFVNALQPLVKFRGERGLKVSVATIDAVYDEFGNGIESPYALREFLKWTQTQWAKPAPRFALLVGKASYDFRDYQNGANKNLVPTFLVETLHLTQAASDNWFVSFDEKTGLPALAIGRIPAKTPEQVTRVVEKIIAYEKAQPAEWHRRAIFSADDKDADFVVMANELVEKLPRDFKPTKIYLADRKGDVKATRPEIIARWNEGAGMLSYIGHGSIDTWAAGPLFSAENLKEIKNADRLPVLITPTCLDGYFYHPQKDSLTEEALFKTDGGIIGGVVPTGLSLTDPQKQLMRLLYAELFEHGATTWGEALWRAKQKMTNDSSDRREVIDTFVWIGDPALRVVFAK
ncbi:MAG: hypothetical protein HZC40_19840 [Chloroflexi bacterium]|nr:hypothetical protein [Chloroflexota bacterium]